MDQKTYDLEIVEMLAKNEDKLSSLYAAYAHSFPSRKDFWNGLALEEVSHGKWVRTLVKRVEEGTVQIGNDRFNVDMMNDFYKTVQQHQTENSQGVSLLAALTAAIELEKTMIEKKFFEVFQGDAPELQTLLLALEYSTENHRDIVEKAWREEAKMVDA